jgi:hypothetical protein
VILRIEGFDIHKERKRGTPASPQPPPRGRRDAVFPDARRIPPMTLQTNYSFIIRIMLEPSPKTGDPREWKGMIQYVASGERRYFRNINDIPVLIRRILHLAPEEIPDRFPPENRRDPGP